MTKVDAAAPWFGPGGAGRRDPQGRLDRDRDHDRGRSRYGEQRFIRYLYQGFLNRQPSSDDLRVWSERLSRDPNPTTLVQEFMNSDEFFIRQTTIGLLGREPQASTLNSYARELQNGKSRADIVEAILSSDEFNNRLR